MTYRQSIKNKDLTRLSYIPTDGTNPVNDSAVALFMSSDFDESIAGLRHLGPY